MFVKREMLVKREEWFKRSFSFGLPVWMFPNIVERLRGTPARIRARIEGIQENHLTKRIRGVWSIQENIGHLIDLESLWLKRMVNFVHGDETLLETDLANRKTHEANYNSVAIDSLAVNFGAERIHLVNLLEACDELQVMTTSIHPRLKQKISLLDHAFFIAEHDDHHLSRITELLVELQAQ